MCPLSHISPLGLLFVVKTLPRTQQATKVKRFLAFCLKLRRSRDTALPALYGYRAVGHFVSAEYARALLKWQAIIAAFIIYYIFFFLYFCALCWLSSLNIEHWQVDHGAEFGHLRFNSSFRC